MSEHMKKHLISKSIYCLSEHGRILCIPERMVEKYLVSTKSLEIKARKAIQKAHMSSLAINADVFFKTMDEKYTKAGALLRGTRHREGLSQIDFAKKLGVTQGDLSKMENGKRSIGKLIAKRIEKKFGVNYRYFLE